MVKSELSRHPENGKNISLQYSVYRSHIALTCVNSLMILLNLLANGFVMFRYYQTRDRQPVSNTLIFLLASFDFLQGAVAQPLFTSSFILELSGIFSHIVEEAVDIATCTLVGFSFTMVAIVLTTERLVAIVYPIHHRIYMRRKILIYVSLTLFGVWAIINVILHLILHPVQLFNLFYLSVFILLPAGLVYTLTIYVKIFWASRRSARIQTSNRFALGSYRDRGDTIERNSGLNSGVNEAYDDSSHNNGEQEGEQEREPEREPEGEREREPEGEREREPEGQREREPEGELEREPDGTSFRRALYNARNAARRVNLTAKEKRTIYRMLCIVGVLCLMSIPLLSAFTCYVLGVSKNLFVNFLYPWAVTFFFANGVINPYIYCYRNEHFRRRNARF